MNFSNKNNIAPNTDNELDKQTIFEQIDSELLNNNSDNSFYRLLQWTKSNYNFVVLLDLCAIMTALVGGIVLYNIFREQSIKLVIGQSAVRSLELTLLEQLDKQREIDLKTTELELIQTKESLLKAEKDLERVKDQYKKESLKELARQQNILEQKILKELQGKSELEQKAIQERFQLEKTKIKQDIEQKRLGKERLYETQYQKLKLEKEKTEEELNTALIKAQKQATQSKTKLLKKVEEENNNFASIVETKNFTTKDSLINYEITTIFNKVQNNLNNKNYPLVETELKKIENIYQKTPHSDIYIVKKKNDLFIISLIREYITNNLHLSNLNNKVNSHEETLNNLQKSITNNSSPSLIQNLRKLIVQLEDSNPNIRQITRKIQNLKSSDPIIIEFLNSYINYQKKSNDPKVLQLLKIANKNIKKENYRIAVENYQTILRLYPETSKRVQVLQGYYDTIKLELQKNQVLVSHNKNTNPNIPTVLQQKALNILKNPRYNIPDSKIIYMNSPDGYIIDIINDIAIITLTSNLATKKGTLFNIFRISTMNIIEMDQIGSLKVSKKVSGDTAHAHIDNNVRIGDLVYLNKK